MNIEELCLLACLTAFTRAVFVYHTLHIAHVELANTASPEHGEGEFVISTPMLHHIIFSFLFLLYPLKTKSHFQPWLPFKE